MLEQVRRDFVDAASAVHDAGADLVIVDCSDGYLLAGFLSPLTNQRDDDYGGPLASRLRFPLEVVRAVAEAVGPVGVRLVADDRHPRGLAPDDGVAMAQALARGGAALLDVTAGLTVPDDATAADYRRLYQVGLADRLRNEAELPTVASGRITTIDEINTVVAAGRADLCVLDPRSYQ